VTGIRILVCGSRDYADTQHLFDVLEAVHSLQPIGVLIEGEAPGADKLARIWAWGKVGIDVLAFPAAWKKYGKSAGHIRNKQMLVEGKPDIVYAFTNKPLSQSTGTLNMVNQARAAGLRVVVVGEDDTDYVRAAKEFIIQEELF
jgi:hypothetical protein